MTDQRDDTHVENVEGDVNVTPAPEPTPEPEPQAPAEGDEGTSDE